MDRGVRSFEKKLNYALVSLGCRHKNTGQSLPATNTSKISFTSTQNAQNPSRLRRTFKRRDQLQTERCNMDVHVNIIRDIATFYDNHD